MLAFSSGSPRHRGRIELARLLLGYEPEVSFKEGLKETVEWFRKLRALDHMQSMPPVSEKNRDLAASR